MASQPDSADREIWRIYQSLKDASLVASHFVQKWEKSELSENHQYGVAMFMIRAGFVASLARVVSHKLKSQAKVPWQIIGTILNHHADLASPECVDKFLKALAHEKSDLLSYPRLFERFSNLKEQFEKQYQLSVERLQAANEKLYQRILFFRNDRLLDEEGRAIDELEAKFPTDPRIKKIRQDHIERAARQKIQSLQSSERITLNAIDDQPDFKEKTEVISRFYEIIKQNPDWLYEVAVALFSLDLFEECIELTEKAHLKPNVFWLKFEALVGSRRYIEALDWLENNSVDAKPETTYMIKYAKARVLRELGETSKAIELLEAIEQTRPTYRQTHDLLREWKSDRK
ncbi:MAG: hypothetical protein COT74_13345 [Bdellovibrionales bacterium CG10_big_fil_rev_8_21_14_0_10_45_34]|nr:MAG: hypothetical protein COT74_13345 [Bdellovibrionales bacterium CG10_big_fil_rev_8_21_14_0_10_45_34]